MFYNYAHKCELCSSLYSRKDQKKVFKLTAMIPYHEGRRNDAEVAKIKEQVESIWQKTKEAAWAMNN